MAENEDLRQLLEEVRPLVVDTMIHHPVKAARARRLLVRIDAALERPQSDTVS